MNAVQPDFSCDAVAIDEDAEGTPQIVKPDITRAVHNHTVTAADQRVRDADVIGLIAPYRDEGDRELAREAPDINPDDIRLLLWESKTVVFKQEQTFQKVWGLPHS